MGTTCFNVATTWSVCGVLVIRLPLDCVNDSSRLNVTAPGVNGALSILPLGVGEGFFWLEFRWSS